MREIPFPFSFTAKKVLRFFVKNGYGILFLTFEKTKAVRWAIQRYKKIKGEKKGFNGKWVNI